MDIIQVVAGIAMGEADAADDQRIVRVAIVNETICIINDGKLIFVINDVDLFHIQKAPT